MPDETTRRITYRGPAPFVSRVVHMLEGEGIRVDDWERPTESRSAESVMESVVSGLIVQGSIVGIRLAVEKVRARLKGSADIKIDGDEDDD